MSGSISLCLNLNLACCSLSTSNTSCLLECRHREQIDFSIFHLHIWKVLKLWFSTVTCIHLCVDSHVWCICQLSLWLFIKCDSLDNTECSCGNVRYERFYSTLLEHQLEARQDMWNLLNLSPEFLGLVDWLSSLTSMTNSAANRAALLKSSAI